VKIVQKTEAEHIKALQTLGQANGEAKAFKM